MQLRKACNHPYLFTGVEDRTLDPLGDHVIQNCGKMFVLGKEGGREEKREGGREGGREGPSCWYSKKKRS
jgi:SNF2 family DNA or RNA helicase